MSASPFFLDLVNSLHIHGETRADDALMDPGAVADLLQRHGLDPVAGPGTLRQLQETRSLLRTAIEQLMDQGRLSSDTVEKLDAAASGALFRLRVSTADKGARVELEMTSGGPAAAAAHSFARFLADGDWRRLKLCLNGRCRWAFVDESRNLSRRWCSSDACGNLMKVRAFRRRASARKAPISM